MQQLILTFDSQNRPRAVTQETMTAKPKCPRSPALHKC